MQEFRFGKYDVPVSVLGVTPLTEGLRDVLMTSSKVVESIRDVVVSFHVRSIAKTFQFNLLL